MQLLSKKERKTVLPLSLGQYSARLYANADIPVKIYYFRHNTSQNKNLNRLFAAADHTAKYVDVADYRGDSGGNKTADSQKGGEIML